jgi:hypothetical protein
MSRVDERGRWVTAGYGIVLVGALAFVVGCFLPYVAAGEFPVVGTPSIWWLNTEQRSAAEVFGASVNLFPGPAALIWISLVAIRAQRAWTAPALIAATIVWSLARIGGLVFSYRIYDGAMGSGYWLMWGSVGVIISGTVMVVMSSREARSDEE